MGKVKTQVKTYEFEGASIRSVLRDEERYYSLSDIDKAVGINRGVIQNTVESMQETHERIYAKFAPKDRTTIGINTVGVKMVVDCLERKNHKGYAKYKRLYNRIVGETLKTGEQKSDNRTVNLDVDASNIEEIKPVIESFEKAKRDRLHQHAEELAEVFEPKPKEPKRITEIEPKEYSGQRVVTFKDIDEVHGRVEGTAIRNFKSNRKHFTEGKHFHKITRDEFRPEYGFGHNAPSGTLITEYGYLKLVKSLTDDLSWEVQDELVEGYFRTKEFIQRQNKKLPTSFAEALRLAADLEEEKQELETQNLMLEQQVSEYQPKATYVDKILDSKDSLLVSQIAEDYGLTAQKLNSTLKQEGVQYKRGGQWLLYGDHKGNGYTESQTHTFEKPNGETGTSLLTKWTQKGRLFIHNILEDKGVTPLMDRVDE